MRNYNLQKKNEVIDELFNTLNDQNILYCHWKSNKDLGKKVKNEKEFDLLVSRTDILSFVSTLASLGYKRVNTKVAYRTPSIHHYYKYDNISNVLIHIHAFFSLITGESLVKNFKIPLEKILLENRQFESIIPIPHKSSELSLFVIRMMLKHASIIEHILVLRDYESIKEELIWLTNRKETIDEAHKILNDSLPEITSKIFSKSISALKKNNAFIQRFFYGQIIKKRLKAYRRYRSFIAVYLGIKTAGGHIFRHIIGRKGSKVPVSGGVVVAFVGPEATGKSTLVAETYSFFSRFLDTKKVHLGRPPFTLVSLLPRSILFIYRRFVYMSKFGSLETGKTYRIETGKGLIKVLFYFLYSVKSILIAFDRKALAFKVSRWAGQGKVVICDRYPTTVVGAMDSPRIEVTEGHNMLKKLFLFLSYWEKRVYSQIPPPEVVIRLTVPLEVAVKRNQMRKKKDNESELYLRNRHSMASKFSFLDSKVYFMDTNKGKKETIKETIKIIWEIL